MKAVMLRFGRGKSRWADEATTDFSRRLKRMEFEEIRLEPETFRGDEVAVRDAEATRLLASLGAGDRLVTLDERGELLNTEEFSALITDAARQSTRRLVFAIGGPYGHGAAARDKAWRVLALSRMVLNHELARVVLVEQLYRASTLLWGGAYHH